MFEVRERDGLARIGVLETRHGRVTTPALLPVVNPNQPIVPPGELASRFGAEILITNAYILGTGALREAVLRDGVHRLLGLRNLRFQGGPEVRREGPRLLGSDVLPGGDPRPPKPLLRPVPHSGHMEERLPEHPGGAAVWEA